MREILGAKGGALLILRIFLGFTFGFASLQKLANPNFFKSGAPGSFNEQVRVAIITSPLHHLLSPALHAPTVFALLIAFEKLAVSIGTLLRLFGRLATLGGMLLSLTFFLVVGFHDHPYFYGPYIVFFFVWTPIAIVGSGRWSLDDFFERRRTELNHANLSVQSSPSLTEEWYSREVRQSGLSVFLASSRED